MAKLRLLFIKCEKHTGATYVDHKVIKTIELVGKRYKRDEECYYCHSNQWGIGWVVNNDICTSPRWIKGNPDTLPKYYDMIVVKKL